MTEIVRSEDYETPALEWLFAQAERLKAALVEAGVTDEAVQRQVCESFVFDLAMAFDTSEVPPEPGTRPRLAFEDAGGDLLLPDDGSFDFHDYAFGVVGEAFGDE